MDHLLIKAKEASKNAIPVRSEIRVGCAIELSGGRIVTGWNIEGLWQTSLHAEVSAISKIKTTDKRAIQRVAIYAKGVDFTPCGACLDWLMMFCNYHTILLTSNGRKEKAYRVHDLYPGYPKL
jgi:cytidine deaminase